MAHYDAIAERGAASTWWISFPGRPGITSAADDAAEIATQAREALGSVLMYPPGDGLPLSIEKGARPPTDHDRSEFDHPMVVVISFAPTMTKAAA